MPNAKIDFPSKTTLDELFGFVIELDYYTQHDRLIINMPDRVFCGPFAMLLLASKIQYLKLGYPKLNVIFNNWDKHSYLSYMGFFDLCGFNHGNTIGQAPGNTRYLPITRMEKNSLAEKPTDKYEEMQDLLQRAVDRVALVLAQDFNQNKELFNVLAYALREIFRNCFEHGETDSLYYCAQYWPNSNKVEFAVSDFGVGIRRGLSRNPNFRTRDDKEAIYNALLPGVSGRLHEPRRSENWFNSGYGLYMTQRLARNGGNFVICSNSRAVCLTPKTKTDYVTSFPGTIIRVNLSVDEIGEVQKRLAEFREDGKKLAASIKGSGNRPPSAVSMLLRRDAASFRGPGK